MKIPAPTHIVHAKPNDNDRIAANIDPATFIISFMPQYISVGCPSNLLNLRVVISF